MLNLDEMKKKKDGIMTRLSAAIATSKTDEIAPVMREWCDYVEESVTAEHDGKMEAMNSEILKSRGVRALTSNEKAWYEAFIDANEQSDPRMAIANIDVAFPETIIDTVIDDVQNNFPFLAKLRIQNTTAITKMIYNKKGAQTATWGKLTSQFVENVTGSIDSIQTNLLKLYAMAVIPKDILDLGPAWVDRYIRAMLTEAMSLGAEDGYLNGDGNGKPIGMIRDVSEGVSVTAGAYPEKTKIKLETITPYTIGDIVSKMAVNPYTNRSRNVNNLTMVVNPTDYLTKVMPATTIQAPDGTYRNNVLPYPIDIVQSQAVKTGTAVLFMPDRYFAGIGVQKGAISYDDSVHFIEDERVYVAKMHACGRACDDNACKVLDISALESAFWANNPASTANTTKKTTTSSSGSASSGS